MAKYKWRKWANSGKLPAEEVAQELERLSESSEGLTAESVLREATPPDAPLHPCFTWDNEKAAHLWRKSEANHLIRSVHIVDESSGEDLGCAFVCIADDDQDNGHYMPVAKVVNEPDLFARALDGLRHRFVDAKKSVDDLEAALRRNGNHERLRGTRRVKQAFAVAEEAINELA